MSAGQIPHLLHLGNVNQLRMTRLNIGKVADEFLLHLLHREQEP